MTVTVQFYTKRNCPLCEEGHEILKELCQQMDIAVEALDIYEDDELLEKYQLKIPVVVVNGRELDYGKISRERVERQLRAFTD